MRTNRTAWSTDMLHGYAGPRTRRHISVQARPRPASQCPFPEEEIVTKRLRRRAKRFTLDQTGLVVSQ
jgi:hypothetical protein